MLRALKAKPTPAENLFGHCRGSAGFNQGVVFFSPCLCGPVGELVELFLACALSPVWPVAAVFLGAWFLPPWESLVF
jgi:hypothetical protein